MNKIQQSDQITYSFQFSITPLQITSTKSIKNLKKSILLKLGNRTEKTSELNKPILMQIDALYSKTLKKYCPIKGIIKIYDINLDGSQVISSVGGFQTQQILNEQKNNVIIERDVGTFKVKMKIQIKNLGVVKGNQDPKIKEIGQNSINNTVKKQQERIILSRSRTKENVQQFETIGSSRTREAMSNNYVSTSSQQKTVDDQSDKPKQASSFNQYFKRSSIPSTSPIASKSQQQVQIKKGPIEPTKPDIPKPVTPNTMKKPLSTTKPSQQSMKNSRQSSFSQSYLRQKENQELGQQLVQERRKTVELENKISKYHEKVHAMKKQRDQTLLHFQKISQGLEQKGGKPWIQINEKDRLLCLKYKDRRFERAFINFVEFMSYELSKPKHKLSFTEQEIPQKPPQSFSSLMQEKSQQQIALLNEQLQKKTAELLQLRSKERQKLSIQIKLKSKERQFTEIQSRLKQFESTNKTLKEQNMYLKQQDDTMQALVTQKQNEIQMLKQQITDLDLQFKQLQATTKNDACQIEQLKEEVSNLNQIIDKYRQKYGDLKNTKNRALQNQLKQCLIWIDQQTRQLEMSDFVEDTQPSHSHNVSEIIKNIQLEGASRQEMNSIKEQLAGLIKRIDNFLAK